MKKIIIVLVLLIFPLYVYAGGSSDDVADVSLKNKCENSKIDCAFCVYDYAEDTGCYAKFSVTYKNDNTPLEYETYLSGSNNGNIKCTFSYTEFKKNDFIDGSGNIKCPNSLVESSASGSGRTAYKNVTFSSGLNGTYAATTESKIVNIKNTNENPVTPESYSCKYGNLFDVSVIGNDINVTLNGYSEYMLTKDVSANSFSNNKCPDLYYYINTREKKIFTIYDENPGGAFIKISGQLIDENTGEEVPTPPVKQPDNNNGEYEDKLNYNSLCENKSIKQTMKLIGYLVQVVKWIVPLIIIVLGMIDFGKATLESDDKALNKATSSLIRRLIAGVTIFFIPTIVLGLLNAIEITNGIDAENHPQFGACTKCIFGAHKIGYCEIPEE